MTFSSRFTVENCTIEDENGTEYVATHAAWEETCLSQPAEHTSWSPCRSRDFHSDLCIPKSLAVWIARLFTWWVNAVSCRFLTGVLSWQKKNCRMFLPESTCCHVEFPYCCLVSRERCLRRDQCCIADWGNLWLSGSGSGGCSSNQERRGRRRPGSAVLQGNAVAGGRGAVRAGTESTACDFAGCS